VKWRLSPDPPPRDGEARWRKAFAWRRTPVGRHIVWLEFYWVRELYRLDAWHEIRRELSRD
jgi:hypothetical protein